MKEDLTIMKHSSEIWFNHSCFRTFKEADFRKKYNSNREDSNKLQKNLFIQRSLKQQQNLCKKKINETTKDLILSPFNLTF